VTRLAEIEAKTARMAELLDVVGAMRSLASLRMQEAHRTLPGVRRYAATMAAAIGSALLLLPEPRLERPAHGRRALVLCSAEHGFVGVFNERLVASADQARGPDTALFILGSRGAAAMRERGWSPDWWQPMPTRPSGAAAAVRQLAAELYRGVAGGRITRIELVFARHHPDRPAAIERATLLPLDLALFPAPARSMPPLHNLPPAQLLEKLIADYGAALLIEAVVESVASENAARFAAMQSARDNVSKKLEQLRQDGRQARQEEVTTELLDVMTGVGAAGKPDGRPVVTPPAVTI